MKKLLALLLALCMIVALAACGQTAAPAADKPAEAAPADKPAEAAPAEPAPAAEPVKMTIALRSGTYADVIESCLPAFEAENNVTIEVQKLDEAPLRENIAMDAINAEGTYDLVMVDGSWTADFATNGVMADLTALGYKLDEDIIPATTAVCVIDGETYFAPYYGNVTVLLYNKELVKAAGFENGEAIKNLDDVLTICKAAQAAGKKGFIFRGDSNSNYVTDFLPILCSFGGWVLDDAGKPSVNTAEFKAAMEFYLDLIATGDAEKRDDLKETIENGSGAMGIGWPGWWSPDKTGSEYGALTGVAHAGDPAYLANVYGIWTIGVPANTKNPELAVKLLAYLMDKDVQLATVPGGGVPCRYSCLQDAAVLADHPEFKVVCAALDKGVYRPVIPQWPAMYEIIGTEMSEIIAGSKTVDQGLADAQSHLESDIEW